MPFKRISALTVCRARDRAGGRRVTAFAFVWSVLPVVGRLHFLCRGVPAFGISLVRLEKKPESRDENPRRSGRRARDAIG